MASAESLTRTATETGFDLGVVEKVGLLFELLEGIRAHPFLKNRMVLKGGTALNLFVFEVPRLSVDIDLNYVGAVDRGAMLAERPGIERALAAVCGRAGLAVRRVPADHAGGKWRLGYTSFFGQPGALELDVNFMLRAPLWPVQVASSQSLGELVAQEIPVLDLHELAAGKLAALFGRSAARDLFDVRNLMRHARLDQARLRLGFVVYGGLSRRDWRTVTLDDIVADEREVARQLVPVLSADVAPSPAALADWVDALVDECRDRVSAVLPLSADEVEFLNALNDRGEIEPERLTSDADLQDLLRVHPGLLWKAQNVRAYRRRRG